jgi:hypothetical protein
MVATAACPQRERVAVTGNFVTTAECYKHSQNTEPPVIYVEDMPRSDSSAEREAAARARTFKPTRPPTLSSDKEYGSTRVESVRGRQTLVNEMRTKP